MKIGKGNCVLVFGGQRRKKKEKKKGRPASGGGRRQAPDTRRPSAGATQLNRGVDTCCLQAGPNRIHELSRPDIPTCDYAEAGARAACD